VFRLQLALPRLLARMVLLVLAVFFTWASDMNGIGANFVLAGTSVWSPHRRRIATQLDVVLGKEHHADILKGAANSLGHNRGRLPTFQFEIVDCAFAYWSGARQLTDGPAE
jgi:hypothetical protein